MGSTFIQKHLPSPSWLKLFVALSRTPHALLDMATPGLAALLWLGAFPPLETVVLGLVTVFAGYTAVYALNDVVDYHVDQEKLERGGFSDGENDLDVSYFRHPIAQNMLSFRQGLIWVIAWGTLALGGAYTLNPICALIFLIGCVLEAIYCILLKISHLRAGLSGAVKASGGIAAVYAVDPSPPLSFLAVLFLWLFFWEIGGQNIPNDWADMEEDRGLAAKTVPIQLGLERARSLILVSVSLAFIMNLLLFYLAPYKMELPYMVCSLGMGIFFLLVPAYKLYVTKERVHAAALFKKASYYPLASLVVVGVSSIQ